MRIGAILLLAVALLPGGAAAAPRGREGSGEDARKDLPRGPYLLRRIFGDLPRDSPGLWGLSPGMLRSQVPPETDLGRKERNPGTLAAFTRDFSGRATVTFVFDGDGPEARLDHITVTVVQAPNITPRAMAVQLGRVYGSADPLPDGPGEVTGSWLKGAVLLRHFAAARFFEVTLSSPRPRPAP